MTKITNILRFDQNGPNGLEEWEQMDYDSLVSGSQYNTGTFITKFRSRGTWLVSGIVRPSRTR